MIVVDASAAIRALLDVGPRGAAARAALSADSEWAAPGVLHAEVLPALISHSRKFPALAEDAVRAFAGWTVRTVESGPLTSRVWELRHNVSARDALYVAAAETLGCPLLTGDGKLSNATGPRCAFRVIPS